ncbi:hypothetical protein JHK82_055865 [Glycine max]|nr:hypothetical protein JHK82_055865 [Glycine max]
MPYPITAEGTQVMTMDEGPQIQALTVYQAIQGSEVDIDPQDETFNRGPKPIKELVQLQLGPKPGQCMQLCRDFTSQEHWSPQAKLALPGAEAQQHSPPRSERTYILKSHPSPTHSQQWLGWTTTTQCFGYVARGETP